MQATPATPEPRTLRRVPQPLEAVQVEGALLKIDTVRAITGMSESSIRRAMAAGDFPAPIKRGPRCTRWPADALRTWLAAQAEKAVTA